MVAERFDATCWDSKKMKIRILLLAAVCLFSVRLQAAAVDYFLKIDGIEGESADAEHRGEIEILSWSWGASNASTGGQTSRAVFQDLQISKRLDKSTPLLMLACAQGKHIPEVIITLRKAGEPPQKYYKVTMQDCIVSSYQTSANSGEGDRPMESFSLNYTKIKFEYTPFDATGRPLEPVIFGWDLELNKPF